MRRDRASISRYSAPIPASPALPPPVNGTRTTQAAIDAAVLDSLRAALRNEVGEVIGIFLENGAKLIADLRQALAQEDAQALERAAHSLKSSSATFGAMELSAICKELEIMGRARQLDGAAEQVRCADDVARGLLE